MIPITSLTPRKGVIKFSIVTETQSIENYISNYYKINSKEQLNELFNLGAVYVKKKRFFIK